MWTNCSIDSIQSLSKISFACFEKIDKLILEVVWELKGLRIAKQSWKKEQNQKIHISWFQKFQQGNNNQDSVVLV